MRTTALLIFILACSPTDDHGFPEPTDATDGGADESTSAVTSGATFIVGAASSGIETTTETTTGDPPASTSGSSSGPGEPVIPPDPEVGDLLVFVSGRDRVFPADALGGGDTQLAGADAACAALAKEAGLAGRFKAWLSTSANSPALRFVPPPAPRRYIQVDGTTAVWSWAELLAGEAGGQVDVDPFGVNVNAKPYPGPLSVWTGTSATGTTSLVGDCYGWTSTSGWAAKGLAGSWGASWTEAGLPASCRSELALYCFEQAPGCRREACAGAGAAGVLLGLAPELAAGCVEDPCGTCEQLLAACDWAGYPCLPARELCGEAVLSCGCS